MEVEGQKAKFLFPVSGQLTTRVKAETCREIVDLKINFVSRVVFLNAESE